MKKNKVVNQIVESIVREGATVNLAGWHTDAWKHMPQP